MTRYNGGSTVKGGYYWNLSKWEVATLQGETGTLPGAADEKFISVPTPAMFVVAPLMGAAYVMFLPFIGFAMTAYATAKKLGVVGTKAAEEMAATVTPAWRPGEAHFAGKPDENAKAGEKKANDGLDKVAKEIADRRNGDDKK